jgi:hypothetical protein
MRLGLVCSGIGWLLAPSAAFGDVYGSSVSSAPLYWICTSVRRYESSYVNDFICTGRIDEGHCVLSEAS